jgi:hypothetical protein
MNAAAMQYGSGAGEASGAEERLRCTPQPMARRERTTINPTGNTRFRADRGLSPEGFETWIGNYYDKMLLA